MSGKLRGCCAATLTALIADIRRKQAQESGNPEVVRGLEQAVVIAKGLAAANASYKAPTSPVERQ